MRLIAGLAGAIFLALIAYLISAGVGLPLVIVLILTVLGVVAGWFAGLELADRSGTGRAKL